MSNKRMLIDAAHPEETRVVVLDGNQIEDFDVEVASRKQLKGNIYLAKVIRVEPSLQAAFVDYGGNRHGFLAFSEIHPDYYQIPVADREALAEAEAKAREKEAIADDKAADEDAASDGEEAANAQDDGDGEAEGETNDKAEAEAGENETASDNSDADATAETTADTKEDAAKGPDAEKGVEEVGGDEAEEVQTRRKTPDFRHYKIQEVIKRRQVILVQVVKEERGNKGAALTTYLSLAGRYCVLMPNTARGGGISRKITNSKDRKALKAILNDLKVPDGMAVILRTAGIGRTKAEIKRDFENLEKLWNGVRDTTLKSTAPTLVHEEGDVVRRALRDLYSRDIDEVMVEGDDAYKTAKEFMKMLIPSHARRIKQYKDSEVSLFRKFGVENQMDAVHNPIVNLPSGGYIVINPTEALVSIDVNSGRATKERNIEETALKTNSEAAVEVARQLRLRDLAGLIVIDFIDMDINRNNIQVERKLKDALKHDRARIQVGRISPFGLLEMSRQRLRPSLIETSSEPCPYCAGSGVRRSTDSTALVVLRAVEEESANRRASEITVHVPTAVALYILNNKREALAEIETKYDIKVLLGNDDSLVPPDLRLERTRNLEGEVISEMVATRREEGAPEETGKRRRRRRRPRKSEGDTEEAQTQTSTSETPADETGASEARDSKDGEEKPKRRRRSRGGRRRRRGGGGGENAAQAPENAAASQSDTPTEAPAKPEATAKPEGDTGSEEKPKARRPRRKTGAAKSDAATTTEAKPDNDGGKDTVVEKPKAKKKAAAKKKPAAKKKAAAKPRTRAKAASKTEAKPEPKSEPKAETKSEPKTKPASDAVADGPKRKGWWNLAK